jgi:TonB family protein
MGGRLIRWLAFIITIGVAGQARGQRQCASEPFAPEYVLSASRVSLVFTGTVDAAQRTDRAESVSFTVDRIWKGPVKEHTIIFRPYHGDDALPELRFILGQRYLVVAHRLSIAERERLGLDEGAEAFGTDVCGDGTRLFGEVSPQLRLLGFGAPPIDLHPGVRRPVLTPVLRIKSVVPTYRGTRGTVVVDFTIDEIGHVGDVKILRSLVPSLNQAAIDCVTMWDFLPALVDGKPSPYHMTATVTFAP